MWFMPRGPVTPCLMATSRPTPVTASTTWPSHSVLMPYLKAVPGSASIGARSAALSPATTLGMPVSFSHCTRSPLKNQ